MNINECTVEQLKDLKENKVEEVTQMVALLKVAREELYQIERRLHEMTDPLVPFIEDDLF